MITAVRSVNRFYGCLVPLAIASLACSEIVEVDGGGGRTCARREDGWVRCWGVGNSVPTSVLDTFRFASITVGSIGMLPERGHACGRVLNGPETVCWPNTHALPAGSPPQTPIVVPGGHVFTFVNSGDERSCGIDASGSALCWTDITGSGAASTPSTLPGGQRWQKLSGGQGFSCGITTAGAAYCFGGALNGQLGTTSDPNLQSCTLPSGATGLCAFLPVAVAGGHTFTEISAGASGACALDTAGAAWCWGNFTGNDVTRSSPTPVAVDGGRTYTRIARANAHSCALTAPGEVFCWGFGKYGQLGDGTGDGINASFAHSPVAVATTTRYRAISADDLMSCAVVSDGSRVDCWGWNRNGELARVDPAAPTNVPGEARW